MSGERALLDTNVLVYAVNEEAAQHAAAHALRERARTGEVDACLAPQVLVEYLSIVTNPKRVPRPIGAADALDDVEKLAVVFPLIQPPGDIVDRVLALARHLGTTGADVFDVQLAATMLAQPTPVTRIYSYDPAIFGRVPGITVLTP